MTQNEQVLAFMKKHGSITQMDAVSFGCYRLSARIHDLRDMGYKIKTENVPNKTTGIHARYSVEEEKQDGKGN